MNNNNIERVREQLLNERKQLLNERETLNEREKILIIREKIAYETSIEESDKTYVKIDKEESLVNDPVKKESVKTSEEIRMEQPITTDLLEKIFGKYITFDIKIVEIMIELIHCDYGKIKWDEISKDKNINHAIMVEFTMKLDKDLMAQYLVLSDETIEKFPGFKKSLLIQYQKLSIKNIENFINNRDDRDDRDVLALLTYQVIPNNLIYRTIKCIHWHDIYSGLNLSDSVMMHLNDYSCWDTLSRWQKFTINSMAKFIKKIDLTIICQNPSLTDEMVEKFSDIINLMRVCQNPSISEESRMKFIVRVSDKDMQQCLNLDKQAWKYVLTCPNLSKVFLLQNKESYSKYVHNNDNDNSHGPSCTCSKCFSCRNGYGKCHVCYKCRDKNTNTQDDKAFSELLDKLPDANPCTASKPI